MKKIGKLILIILLIGLVVAGISALVKASPNTQPSPATYSIQITQNDCIVKVLDAENTPVDKLTQSKEYTITATLADGYIINTITLNEQPITLPYTFTATEDISIFANGGVFMSAVTANGFNLTYTLQNCTISFYKAKGTPHIQTSVLESGTTNKYSFVVTPFDGYVIEDVKVNGVQASCPFVLDTTKDVDIQAVAVLPQYATVRDFAVKINIDFLDLDAESIYDTDLPDVIVLNKDNPSVTYNFTITDSNLIMFKPANPNYALPYNVVFADNTITFDLAAYAFLASDLECYHAFSTVSL